MTANESAASPCDPSRVTTEPNRHLSRWDLGVAGSVFALLLACVYWPTLEFTFRMLTESEDMAHGFFAPLIAGYIAWTKKDKAFPPGVQTSGWGLPLLVAAALIGIAGTIGASSTVSRFALLISLCGCAVVLGGWRALRTMAFPISLLLFTFPIPAVLYAELTLPLQILSTRLAEMSFELLGFSVIRDGNILELANQRLSVVEACSGIRSLITLSFFCLVYSYLLEPRNSLRAFVVTAAIPAAIGLNTVRIVVTGILGKYAPALTVGVYHESLGWVVFVIAFGVVLLAHMAVRRVYGGAVAV